MAHENETARPTTIGISAYNDALALVLTIARTALPLPLEAMLSHIAEARLFSPNLYKLFCVRLDRTKPLLETLLAFQRELDKQGIVDLEALGSVQPALPAAKESVFPPCEHDCVLVMGREEHGGRRFPMRWCQRCGALSLDAELPHPEIGRSPVNVGGWLPPQRSIGTSAAQHVLRTMLHPARPLTDDEKSLLFDAMALLDQLEPRGPA